MKPFDQLTNRGKARRLRKLTINALNQYEFEVADIRLVGMRVNTVFRVRTAGGSSYIIRICKPGWRTIADLSSEIAWLRALSRDTDIGVPEPQPTWNGNFIVRACAEGVPEVRHCVVLSWIPGTLLGARLTETNLYKMGVLFARLHEQAADFTPPKGFTQRKMDTIYACGERDVLFYDSCRDAFTPRTRDILERTRDKVDEAFERLYADPTGLRVIHNDLHHNNVKIHRGRLHPFDFEHTMWGYPVQDFAVALDGLMIRVARDEFEPLQRAFRAGYESRIEWPETYKGQIDTFQAGRMLWAANYVAQFEREHLGEHLDRLAPQFERFLETGVIRKF
jgi:Ser/Thr protein kinase RdoA (MazF antagonist)